MEDLQKIKNTVGELSTVQDAQSLFHRQGQLDILNLLLTRKEACEQAYENLEEQSWISSLILNVKTTTFRSDL